MYERSFKQDGFTVTVKHEFDEYGGLSWLTDVNRYAGCAPEEIAEYQKQDNERLEAYDRGDWCLIGVCVSIRKQTSSNWANGGLEVGRASVWGIESDCDKEYFAEIEMDMIAEAFEEVNRLKAALCGDKLSAAVSDGAL